MKIAIIIFMIIGMIATAISTMGIGLFWCVPMFVHYCKNSYFVGAGFKIYTLLFVNTIAGILMFCDD